MSGGMYLGAAHFDGDPGELLPAYHRMLERFGPESLALHVCVTRDGGLTVFDACPTREIYEEFTASDTFRDAIAAAGLPAPRTEALGDVHIALLRQEVRQ
jgi:hypothetical protein